MIEFIQIKIINKLKLINKVINKPSPWIWFQKDKKIQRINSNKFLIILEIIQQFKWSTSQLFKFILKKKNIVFPKKQYSFILY